MCLWLEGGDTVYYNLTKEEYKKKEADFKKTYMGNRKYMKKLISFIVFLLFIIDLLIGFISANFSEETTSLVINMNLLFSLSGFILIGICTVMVNVDYENSLKEYVNSK